MSEFGAAGTKAGMEIWRIEDMKPVPVPKKMYGKFYEGDAYIVCKATQKPKSSSLDVHIFFWLGKDCSKDEMGVAAYKTVELDETLGGGAVQHREVQNFESDRFLQSFKMVEYLKGGVASGFTHVERDVYETRLLRCKGSRSVRVSQMPLAASSLNSGDVFILDLGAKLIQWNGSEANRKEKAKGLDVCIGIKDDERGGKVNVIACEQGAEPDEFWSALGGKAPIAPAVDDASETLAKTAAKLIKVSDAAGSLSMAEVASGELSHELLDTNDVFVMDNEAEIFVWIGKGASTDERKNGLKLGTDYATQAGRPKGTRVTKVMEGTEPTTFKSNFASWATPPPLLPGSYTPRSNVAAAGRDRSGSELVRSMGDLDTAREHYEADVDAVDDGSGKLEVFRIEDFEAVPVDPSLYGQFYAGDSYIVKYTYLKGTKEQYLIYFWLGSLSSKDEQGAAALHAMNMDDALGGAATQVRVTMGKEPLHFVRCFKGEQQMVVHSGGKASGFKNKADADSYDKDGTALFHVKGADEADARAVQVAETAASLNSGDCFVLLTPSTIFCWKGSGANDAEGTTAEGVASLLKASRDLEVVAEGAEPDAFWEALGGKGEYPTAKVLDASSREPMLIAVSNATGELDIEPIFDFGQADLAEDDVFILDTFTTIFVWVGSEANDEEKKGAEKVASGYIRVNTYDASVPIVVVKSGAEPPIFTCHFLGWTSTAKKAFVDPYEAKLAAALAANAPEPEPEPEPEPVKEPEPVVPDVTDGYTLNYDELKKPTDQLPKGVDPSKKEQYLSDADFEKVLGSPRNVFEKLKPWKQAQLKKAAGIF